MDDHFINQTTQQRFLLWLRQNWHLPELGEFLPDGGKGRLEIGRQDKGDDRAWLLLPGGRFCLLEITQGSFPALFQFSRDQAILGIDAVELSLCQGRVVPKPLQGLLVRMVTRLLSLCLCRQCLRIDSEFDGREGLEKGLDHAGVDRVGRNVLTDADAILLP